jgi:hypothetical protein
VINPAHASAERVRETTGLRERWVTLDKGKACPNDSAIPKEGRRLVVVVPRHSARIWVGWNRSMSFMLTEGLSAFPTIIPSLMRANKRLDLPVKCPHEIQAAG